jgi:sec-independent protein translocase protein TatA
MGEFAPLHWLVVLVGLLILFGPKKIPELGRGLGEAIRGFKASISEPDEPEKTPPAK